MIESITSFGTATFGGWWPLIWTLVRAVCIILPLLLCVAYLILWERKLIGWMHERGQPWHVHHRAADGADARCGDLGGDSVPG